MTKFEHAHNYTMEKAILKTLAYADIFNYPLTVYEIHKWLIGRRATLRQLEGALARLSEKLKAKSEKGYYFLPRQDGVAVKRRRREAQSAKFLRKTQFLTIILKIIPWIKLVGISGGLAMENARKSDDIDLFIIAAKKRLWITRFLALVLLSLTGQRRKVKDRGRKIAGKFCINTLLEEDKLEQNSKDIYLAHEVLQMKVLWQRDGVYQKYLEDNSWAFRFLPNWKGNYGQVVSSKYKVLRGNKENHNTYYIILNTISNIFEKLSKKFQLWYMKSPTGMERIEDGALYFHPNDIRPQVLAEYKRRVKTIP